jgi:formylglycine-generating enzyme required for sulfatase activity
MRASWIGAAMVTACAVPDAEFDNPLDPVAETVEPESAIPGSRHIKTLAGQTFAFSYIAAGTFTMGTPGDAGSEYPHTVTLTKAFLLQRTETTQAQYQAVTGSNPSSFGGDAQRAVERVNWTDAVAFCDKLSQMEGVPAGTYGLPTEAQWEYAARAGTTGSTYGNLADIAWYSANSGDQSHAVKGKQANAWSLYDMLGNVWEWTADWYSSSYYASSPGSDPTGPTSGSGRVGRGGGWDYDASYSRAASRYIFGPDSKGSALGFRPRRSLP